MHLSDAPPNETRSSACSPVSQQGPRAPLHEKRRPLNSLTARPSEHQRMNETFGMKRSKRGVASGEMLKPLKMIMSTSSGGNIASAASVEGATAPR